MAKLSRVLQQSAGLFARQLHRPLYPEASFGFRAAHITLALALLVPSLTTLLHPPRYLRLWSPQASPSAEREPYASEDLIFQDGFESGDFSAWDNAVTAGGALTVTTAAALTGTFGLQATISGTQQMFVVDKTPDSETHYRARFYFDPNGLSMQNGDVFGLDYGAEITTTVFIKFLFGYTTYTGYQVKIGVRDDGGTWQDTSWYAISDASHHLEFEWQASTGPGEDNGFLKLWIDDTLRETVSDLDDDTREVDKIKLGALTGVDDTITGTLYLDAFESRRDSYIGPLSADLAPETGKVFRVKAETDDRAEFNQTAYRDSPPDPGLRPPPLRFSKPLMTQQRAVRLGQE